MTELPQALPRAIRRDTVLVGDGQTAALVYPAGSTCHAALAARLNAAIERRAGARLERVEDRHVLPRRDSRLPDAFRRRPLLLLGNLNNNRALAPLYARYFCATDATYPGPGGCDVRTLVNPHGTRVNSLLLGGSDAEGVERAARRLIDLVDEHGRPGRLAIPFTLDVSLAPGLARKFADWPDTRLGAPIPEARPALLTAVGTYAILYAWTGDRRYGEHARDCLRVLNRLYDTSYGDWHYAVEKIARAAIWLSAGGLLDDADVLRTDQLLLGTAIGTQHMWWRMSSGQPPLGHRHHGKGTYAFLVQARYLLDHAELNAPARALCERWVGECQDFLDALVRARVDDQDDESTLNNLSTLVWYALGEERFDLFESGNAWLIAQRALAAHDNMGAGAGIEGYGEGLLGAMYYHQEASPLVAASAFYYQDAQLKWIRQRLPHLEEPLRLDGWSLSPLFMHKFDTGDELPPAPPARLTGLRRLPISPYQMRIMRDPPIHIEPRGHFVDRPETWRPQGGVGRTALDEARAFDKLVLRGGFDPGDPYLLLQGYHGGYRWQGSVHALNAIVRFSQAGHIFLIQNTNRQSYLHKNGLLISDGFDETPISPAAEWLAVDDFPSAALSATRVGEYHRASWTRALFWSKRGDGCCVVIDAAQTTQAGPYSFTCTWRTPGYAELRDAEPAWQARQGDHVFRLTWGGDLRATSAAQGIQGAASPCVLRQVQDGDCEAGQRVTFHNLFCVRRVDQQEGLRVVSLSPTQALVTGDDGPRLWCAVDPGGDGLRLPGLEARAVSAMAGRDELALAGATALAVGGMLRVESDWPVGVYLDPSAGRLIVQADTPDSPGAHVQVAAGSQRSDFLVVANALEEVALPPDVAACLAEALAGALAGLGAAASLAPAAEPRPWPAAQGTARASWTFDRWQPAPDRIRDVVAAARPAPLDGFADQLVDGVTPEFRTLSAQWPDAPQVEVQLELGREQVVDHLRIVGDSQAAPTLRAFRPLPDGIEVSVSSDGFAADARRCEGPFEADVAIHRRFYHAEDPLQALRVPVRQTARHIRLRVPRPADGGPLVLHEIELYGGQPRPPRVAQLTPADLDGDGRDELVAVSSADEVVVLGADGREHWRWRSQHAITHLSCHDLDGDGRRQVCAATLAREVRIFEPDGAPRQTIRLADFQDRVADVHLGMLAAVNSIAVWHREPDGRGALVLGCYGLLAFLDPAGRMLGHSYVDGAWITDLLALPGRDGFDLWARSRWNHGVNVYQGRAGLQPSAETLVLGGVAQPLFRGCRQVIPFVTGDRVLFEHVARPEPGVIAAANESGFGVLSVASDRWLWTVEGGMPVAACAVAGLDAGREPEMIVGGGDGFVASFSLAGGAPLRRRLIGAPVTGLAASSDGSRMVVAARDRLVWLDRDWREIAARPAPCEALCALGGGVVAAGPDGRLSMLAFEP